MLILLDGRSIEQVEIVVASLSVHVEAGGGRINLYGIERVAVLGPRDPGRKQVQLQKVASIQGYVCQQFAFNHGADLRTGFLQQRR